MKAYLFFCEKSSLNDATNYYVGLIERGLNRKGIKVSKTQNTDDLCNADIIVTITVKAFFLAKCKNRKAKTIFWSQGVAPEEAIMGKRNLLNYYRYICRFFLTFIALHLSDIVFLVSEEMKRHYVSMYFCKLENAIVMPCYNLSVSPVFNLKQYESPTFVYAGSSAVWQGVDLMLDVYSLVEKSIPSAHITILSKDKEKFEKMLALRKIKNYDIKYVKMDKLHEELHKNKYGFILRDNNVVNRVATPTKMNSYLSNYVIPIFSNTVDDFNRYINLGEFTIKAKYPLDANTIAQQVIRFEKSKHDFCQLRDYVNDVFANHYNDELYLTLFENAIKYW